MKSTFLILFISVIQFGFTQTQKWELIGTYSGAKMYVETNLLKKRGPIVKTMVQFKNSSPQPVSEGSSLKYTTVVGEYTFNCIQKKYKRKLTVYYDSSDNPVYKGKKTKWQKASGAILDALNFVCK